MRVLRVTAALVLSLAATQPLRADDNPGDRELCLLEAAQSWMDCLFLQFPEDECSRMHTMIEGMCRAQFPN